MLALGLTGDVGAGKSTLVRLWEKMGASVLDADKVVRTLWGRSDVLDAAVSRWGEDILDSAGRAIPSAVASKAFTDLGEYKWLCALLHPLVRVEMEKSSSSLEGWVVAEIPLLFEGGIPWWIDGTIYITAPEDIRRERNTFRGWQADEIPRRESFLLSGDEKRARADLVIENISDVETLTKEASCLAERFRRLSSLARASVFFPDRERTLRFMDFLHRKTLGTEFLLRPAEAAETKGKGITLEFFTLERWFGEIAEVLSSFSGTRLVLDKPRRIPLNYRNALSEALRP